MIHFKLSSLKYCSKLITGQIIALFGFIKNKACVALKQIENMGPDTEMALTWKNTYWHCKPHLNFWLKFQVNLSRWKIIIFSSCSWQHLSKQVLLLLKVVHFKEKNSIHLKPYRQWWKIFQPALSRNHFVLCTKQGCITLCTCR